jgi:hypothetical protein
MNCVEISELLPWFLNDTLEPVKEHLVQEHLEQCGRCQRELDKTIFVRQIYRRNALKAVAVIAVEKRNWWKLQLAWVAGAAVLVALSGWIWGWQQRKTLKESLSGQQLLGERNAGQEAEIRRLLQTEARLREERDVANGQIAQLQEKAKEWELPHVNSPLFDVRPVEPMQYKSGGQTADPIVNELEVPSGAKFVVLILNAQSQESYRGYGIEILDAQKNVKWNDSGMTRNPSNDYTITLPVDFLTPGASYTINVYGENRGRRVKVESYRIRVKPAR